MGREEPPQGLVLSVIYEGHILEGGVLQRVLGKLINKRTATRFGIATRPQMKELRVEESKYILYYFLHVLHNYIINLHILHIPTL